jgi:hypothetical protein
VNVKSCINDDISWASIATQAPDYGAATLFGQVQRSDNRAEASERYRSRATDPLLADTGTGTETS